MRMAHVVTEMSAFSTNCTFCHDSTSLSLLNLIHTGSNNSILTEIDRKCKEKIDFFQNSENKVSFFGKSGYNIAYHLLCRKEYMLGGIE